MTAEATPSNSRGAHAAPLFEEVRRDLSPLNWRWFAGLYVVVGLALVAVGLVGNTSAFVLGLAQLFLAVLWTWVGLSADRVTVRAGDCGLFIRKGTLFSRSISIPYDAIACVHATRRAARSLNGLDRLGRSVYCAPGVPPVGAVYIRLKEEALPDEPHLIAIGTDYPEGMAKLIRWQMDPNTAGKVPAEMPDLGPRPLYRSTVFGLAAFVIAAACTIGAAVMFALAVYELARGYVIRSNLAVPGLYILCGVALAVAACFHARRSVMVVQGNTQWLCVAFALADSSLLVLDYTEIESARPVAKAGRLLAGPSQGVLCPWGLAPRPGVRFELHDPWGAQALRAISLVVPDPGRFLLFLRERIGSDDG